MKRPCLDVRGVIFDIDGTLMYPDRPVPGAAEAVRHVKEERGCRVMVLSNSTAQPIQQLVAGLQRAGFPIHLDEAVDMCQLTAKTVEREVDGGEPIYVIGSEHLRYYLREAGLDLVTEPEKAHLLVTAGYGKFCMSDIRAAMAALYGGARYIAVNQDRMGIGPQGLFPGAGALVGAIGYITDLYPELVVGKPSRRPVDEASRRMGLPADECLLVGDSLETDIAAGVAAGVRTALVRSGVSAAEERASWLRHSSGGGQRRICSVRPDLTLASVCDLVTSF